MGPLAITAGPIKGLLATSLATFRQRGRVSRRQRRQHPVVRHARLGHRVAQRARGALHVVGVVVGVGALDHPRVGVAEETRDLPHRHAALRHPRRRRVPQDVRRDDAARKACAVTALDTLRGSAVIAAFQQLQYAFIEQTVVMIAAKADVRGAA